MGPGVDLDDVHAWATHEGLHFIDTSAKTGENVSELFEQVAGMVALIAGPTRLDLAKEAGRDDKCC
jgi:translation initiation factor IF-2